MEECEPVSITPRKNAKMTAHLAPLTPENGWIYLGNSPDGGQFFWKRDEMADYAPESEPLDG